IFGGHRWGSRILVERHDELTRRRPGSLLILGHLENCGPVIEKTAKGGSNDGRVGQTVRNPHARLNVVVRVVPETPVWRNDDVRRQRAAGDTWGFVVRRRAVGSGFLKHVHPRVIVKVSDPIVAFTIASIHGYEGQVVTRAYVHGQFVSDPPLILEVEAVNPPTVLRLEHVAVRNARRDSQEERRKTEAAALAARRTLGCLIGAKVQMPGVEGLLETIRVEVSSHTERVLPMGLSEIPLPFPNVGN